MAVVARIEGDIFVAGDLSASSMGVPELTIVDAMVATGAAIGAAKLVHQYEKNSQQESGTTATDETYVNHVAYGAGTLQSFKVGAVTACVGAATCDIDLLKNGVTVLNAAAQLTSSITAFELVTGVIGTAAYVAGDVFEVDIDTTAGGGTEAVGVFANAVYREAAV